MQIPMKVIPGYFNSKPGIQVSTWLQDGEVTVHDDDSVELDPKGVQFLQQLGIEWVMIFSISRINAKIVKNLREALEANGLKLYRVGHSKLHHLYPVVLNLPNRDEVLDRYLQMITDIGEAGVRYITHSYMGNGMWRSVDKRPIRGGAMAKYLDFEKPMRSPIVGSPGEAYKLPLSFDREFSVEELWENYYYFIEKLVPVAEKAGVRIGFHPNDPPVYTFGGIPRPIFGTYEGFKKAIDYANSPNIGACLCTGCWLEGGPAVGSTPKEFIRYFGSRKKLFKLHVRNVVGTLDQKGGFAETYPNDGYGDVVKIAETLREVGFDGCIMNDHLAPMVGGDRVSAAFQTAYLEGLVDAVNHR